MAEPRLSWLVKACLALACAVVALFALLAGRQALQASLADADTLRARWLVNQWRDNTGPVLTQTLWQQTQQTLNAARERTPDNAQILDDLGYLYAGLAVGLGNPEPGTPEHTQQQNLFMQTLSSYRQATVLRPTYPYTWAYLAQTKHLLGQPDAEMWLAFDKAVRYGRNEPGVQMAVARVAFIHWATLDPQRKTAVNSMIETARPEPRKELYQLGEANGVGLLNM
jgi:hypothetical protein